MAGRRSGSGTRSRWVACACGSSGRSPGWTCDPRTAAAASVRRLVSPAGIRLSVRPAARPVETRLLVVVAIGLALGWLGMASTMAGAFTIGDPVPLVCWILALAGVHLAFMVSGRALDQVLLPLVGL